MADVKNVNQEIKLTNDNKWEGVNKICDVLIHGNIQICYKVWHRKWYWV